uniref:Uncharacterized protein n=1 Tax=Arundo donax TaxID=35708 RepID=A0A0A9BTH4_ARUDO
MERERPGEGKADPASRRMAGRPRRSCSAKRRAYSTVPYSGELLSVERAAWSSRRATLPGSMSRERGLSSETVEWSTRRKEGPAETSAVSTKRAVEEPVMTATAGLVRSMT